MNEINQLIEDIKKDLGEERLRNLKKNGDNEQEFWLGVLEALPQATKFENKTHYLIVRGYRNIQIARRSEGRHQYIAYCKHCGKYLSFQRSTCPKCGGELEYLAKQSEATDRNTGSVEVNLDFEMTVAQFVESVVDEIDRYIAKRWLVDRADLKYQNYQKQISFELGRSQSNIGHRIIKIKQAFQVWYRA